MFSYSQEYNQLLCEPCTDSSIVLILPNRPLKRPIEKTHHHVVDDCCTALLEHWLKRTSPPPTWSALINALQSPCIGYVDLTNEIEAMYVEKNVRSKHQTDLSVCHENFLSINVMFIYYIRFIDHSQDLVLNQNSVYFQSSRVIFYASFV